VAIFTDQTGYEVNLALPPSRIISLVPSQTELLYELGLEKEVAGITKFCIHPAYWFRTKPRIGGTKSIHLDKIVGLGPDLVIANKEENVREQVEAIRELVPVWTSDVSNLETALDMILGIGELVGKKAEASVLANEIRNRFIRLRRVASPLKTTYLIWKNPYMTVGRDTFIFDMLNSCGFDLIWPDYVRYPEISIADLKAAVPDLVLLSSEPYPFKQKDLDELQEILPATQIRLVDGEYFSWYGSRMKKAPDYFQNLIDELGVNP